MTATNHSQGASTAETPSKRTVCLLDCRGDGVTESMESIDNLPYGWYVVNFKDEVWCLYSTQQLAIESIEYLGSFDSERLLYLDEKLPLS